MSLGHVGFYAIGAYTVAILTLKGVDFWIALPLAGAVAGIVGFVLALPALRVTGPYLAMVTIAFAFIVQHGTIEWRTLTGGSNGLMGIPPPSIGALIFSEREMAMLAVALAGASLYAFHRLARSGWGMAMVAVRDAEPAARSIGLNPVIVKTAAFSLSAVFTGLAGGIFAPLLMFVAPDSFPFSQSILFLFAVIVGGAGWTFGPVVGALVSVVLPELLSGLAEYRLLFFGAALLVILWVAPEGVLGLLARLWPRRDSAMAVSTPFDVGAFLTPAGAPGALEVRDLGITFGGIKAATAVTFTAPPGKVTSVIGPNGAGKTTVLNLIGGFYRPDSGSIRLGERELAGRAAWKVARAGIARTYQTTKLFATMSIIDNVLIALRRGRLGSMAADAASRGDRDAAEALLAFVGYHGSLSTPAGDLPHVDRRLVEIARALAMRPRVLLLDEPAAGLMRSDKDALSRLIRRIADLGIAVILVEHDMLLVMGISDAVIVLDAGVRIAAGSPIEVRHDPRVLKAYLGGGEMRARPRATPWSGAHDAVLTTVKLTAGYGAAPVLDNVSLDVRPGGDGHHHRLERRRQVDHHARDLGAAAPGRRRHRPRQRPDQRARDPPDRAARTGARAGGPASLPRAQRARQPRARRAQPQGRRPRRRDRGVAGTLSALAGAAHDPRRAPLRRRAADAGDRAWFDGQAAHPAARRALARPRTGDDQRTVRHPRRLAR